MNEESDGMALDDAEARVHAKYAGLREAARQLSHHCNHYRHAHDVCGDGSPQAGHEWTQMRRYEKAVAQALDALDAEKEDK